MRNCALALLVVFIGGAVHDVSASSRLRTTVHTTLVFTDDPVVAGQTIVKAVHVTELRDAVNAARDAAGLGPYSFTDSLPPGTPVKAIHLMELRDALAAARLDLRLTAVTYTNATLTNATRIRAIHVQELRTAVRLALDPPAITSFNASPTSVPPQATTQLTAVFSGGTGIIRNSVNAATITVTSGTPVTVTVAQNTTYTLTVTNTLGDFATSMTSVSAVLPTVTLTRPAIGTTQLIATDDVRCTPGPCPNADPLLYNLSASTTAGAGSSITFLLNGTPLGASVPPSGGVVTNVPRSLANGPAQQLAARVSDPYGNIVTSQPITLDINSALPVAADDHFDTRQNVALSVPSPGVLSNDAVHRSTLVTYGATVGNEQTSLGLPAATTAGGSVTMTSSGGFDYTPPSASYTGTDTFRYVITSITGSATGNVSVFVYSQSCGTNAPAITLVVPGVAAPFDEYTLNAVAQSADDDPSICPSQFANASYTFSWSVLAPATRYAFTGVGNTSPNSSQAGFRTGESGQLTLRVSAVGNKTNVFGASNQGIGGCPNGIFLSGITFTDFSPGGGYPGHVFRDDLVNLNVSAAAPCYSNPSNALLTYSWSLLSNDGALLSSPTAASPTFQVKTPATTYTVSASVADGWGHTSAPVTLQINSDSCGVNPISVVVVPSAPNKPMDPWSMSSNVSSNDDNVAVCPSRFAQLYTRSWYVIPSDGSTLSAPNSSVTNFTPEARTQYTVGVQASGSNGGMASGTTTIDTSCGAPAISSLAIVTLNGAPYDSQPIKRLDNVAVQVVATSLCVTTPAVTYAWTVSPNGDGTTITGTGSTVSFTPQSITTYTIGVVVTDVTGQFSSNSIDIPVNQ